MGLDSHTNAVAHYSVNLQLACVRRRDEMDYTQNLTLRWDGIRNSRDFPEIPHHADCSAFDTWAPWAARRKIRGRAGTDVMNGLSWNAGNTDSMIQHGARHSSISSTRLWHPGRTFVFYADSGSRPTHVAGFVGDVVCQGGELVNGRIAREGEHFSDMVVSMGRTIGPELRDFDYRRRVQARAYAI